MTTTTINQKAVTALDLKESYESNDYIIQVECEACGEVSNEGLYGDEDATCPECGSDDTIPETSHEGMDCAVDGCGHTFDMWEDGYIVAGELVCDDCHTNMEGAQLA